MVERGCHTFLFVSSTTATRKSSEEKIGVLKDHLEEEKTQRETDVQKMLETMKTVETSAVQNISDVKDRVVGMTGQIDYFYRELKEISKHHGISISGNIIQLLNVFEVDINIRTVIKYF